MPRDTPSRSAPDVRVLDRRLYGVAVEVHGPPEALAAAAPWLPPMDRDFPARPPNPDRDPPVPRVFRIRGGPTPGGGDNGTWSLQVAGSTVLADASMPAVVRRIASDAKLWVSALTLEAVFVHAGVVVRGDHALLLPGRSGVGKTTLVRALVEAGWCYYSDDMAVLDPDGRVWPFAHPLAIRERRSTAPGGVAHRRHVTAADLGGVTGSGPVRPMWVLDTHHQAGAEFAPRVLTKAETVMVLLANAPAARLRPRAVLEVLSRVARESTGESGARGDANSLARTLAARYV